MAANLRDVRLAAFAFIGFLALEALVQGAGYFAGRAADAVVDNEGWAAITTQGSVLMAFVTDYFDDAVIVLVLLQVVTLVYLLVVAGRVPRALGLAQAYAPWFTGVSLVIPLACLYRPWVGLGESRATLETIVESGRVPEKAVARGVGSGTVVFAIALFIYNYASLALAPIADSDKVTDLASAHAFTATLRQSATVDLILDLIFLAVFAWYWLDFLDLYRKALPIAAASQPGASAGA